MMKSIKSPAITKFKAVLVIPITLILILIFSCSKSDDMIISENNRFKELSLQNNKLEKFAEFPGGPKIEYEFIKANFRTPAAIKEKGIDGKIHIGFIIEKDGSLSSVHIINAKHVGNAKYLKNFGYGCDEEALRVVKSMPKWTPAIKDGKPIASAEFIPIIIGDENRVFNEEDSSSTSYLYKGEKFDIFKEPVFGANQGDLLKFISDNIRYPENARSNNISGKVILSFDISPEGKTENIKVIQGVGGGCTEEAIRVVKLFPKWTPAFVDNKPIGVNRVLPIVFKLK